MATSKPALATPLVDTLAATLSTENLLSRYSKMTLPYSQQRVVHAKMTNNTVIMESLVSYVINYLKRTKCKKNLTALKGQCHEKSCSAEALV